MQPETQAPANPTWMTWLGWIIMLLPTAALAMSAYFKLVPLPEFADNFVRMGWRESSTLGLAIVEIGCLLLYLFPRTALLGAVLLTGYLGGATATHVRIGDAFVLPIMAGVLIWLGLGLRDARLRALLPWRGDATVPATGGFLAGLAKVFLTLVVIVGVLAALISAQPTEFRVSRSITIAAPASEVFPYVNNFHKWAKWTPWLEADPATKVTIEGPPDGKGAIYTWSGNDKVGEGKMILTDSDSNERVKIKLEFVRPMPGTPDVEFTFKGDGKQTVVTWTIMGENNFMGKAFSSFVPMDQMIGSKFEKGLATLKSRVEADGKK